MHTTSGVECWHGLEYTSIPPSSNGTLVSILVLYRDANIHTALVVAYINVGSFGTLVTNDTLGYIETSGTGTSIETHVDRSCATSPTLANPLLQFDLSSVCTPARFTHRSRPI